MRIKSLVVLSLVCSLSQAADTVASLGDSIKATQFVTEVDHTKLINGNSKLTLGTDGTVRVGTDQSPLGNPIVTIHAGSVFTGDTADHGKTFATNTVIDYTYVDLETGAPIVILDGWVFVCGPTEFWTGPTSWPSYCFNVSGYDSESPTLTFDTSDPSCSFSGTITVTRPRGAIIPTIDHVLPGETTTTGSFIRFTAEGYTDYIFNGPGAYNNNPLMQVGVSDIEFYNSRVGIMNPGVDGASIGYIWGVGQFWKNGYRYTFPYTDNNGSGDYTLATTSMTNGLASKTYVDSHQWTWASITNKPTNVSAFNNDAHYTRASLNEITGSPRYPNLCLIDDTDSTEYEVPYIQYLAGGSESFAMRVGGLQFYPENWVTETITNGLISQAWVNSQPFVKTNAQGTLVVGPNQYQPNGGHWSMVVGGGGSQTKSDNTTILSPGSNIGTNSAYSAVFGPGAYIHDNAQYSFAFGGGVNIQDNCNDSFVVGSGAQSAHKCAFQVEDVF